MKVEHILMFGDRRVCPHLKLDGTKCMGFQSLTPMADRENVSVGNWWRCGSCGTEDKEEAPVVEKKVDVTYANSGYVRVFGLNKNQYKKYLDWANHCDTYAGAIGGSHKFTFTPTGLGTCEQVECMCGETLNLTEMENW